MTDEAKKLFDEIIEAVGVLGDAVLKCDGNNDDGFRMTPETLHSVVLSNPLLARTFTMLNTRKLKNIEPAWSIEQALIAMNVFNTMNGKINSDDFETVCIEYWKEFNEYAEAKNHEYRTLRVSGNSQF